MRAVRQTRLPSSRRYAGRFPELDPEELLPLDAGSQLGHSSLTRPRHPLRLDHSFARAFRHATGNSTAVQDETRRGPC